MSLSRRDLGKRVTAAALAAPLAAAAQEQSPRGRPNRPAGFRFPAGFKWGCATASYQIEGAVAEDGRKPSVWDTWSHTPGKTANGESGDIATDSYHRYKEDVELLKSLGVSVYRFSFAWPRIFPDGTGQPNEAGVSYYSRVLDELLAAGIQPYATLFHWDLPQALEDRVGGWQSKDTSQAFADYAGFVAGRFSDRIKNFFTINEFSCFTDEGYGSGTKAPGKRLGIAQVAQVRHNAVLGHGLGALAIRAAAKPGTRVGIAENPTVCVPVIETASHIAAAQKAMRSANAPFLTAVFEGRYMDEYLSALGSNAPKTTPAEMQAIGAPLDFVGMNIYTPTYVRAAGNAAGFAIVPRPSSSPRMASPWLYLGPECAYWGPRHLSEIWKVKELHITENGCSSDDVLTPDRQVYDTDRVMYVRNHLIHAHRAVSEGIPLKGYFLWSLMDNFEWADGYTKRFGIHYVDFPSQARIPKLSAEFYKEVIARNTVV
jgi:beta-glucosidase